MPVITCVEDLRVLAKKRVPKMFFDYADSGAWTEGTYRANEADFAQIQLRQRVLVDMTGRTLGSDDGRRDVAMPVALAPTGLTGMQHADGEILAAQAAEEFGVPFTLSTMSICSIEDVAARDHEAVLVPALRDARPRLRRAPDRPRQGRGLLGAGADARPADPRPAPQGPAQRPVGAAEARRRTTSGRLATRPRWCMGMLGTKRRTFGNIVGHAKSVGDLARCRPGRRAVRPALSWKDVEWIKERWGGKLILKGILDVEDAQHRGRHGRRRDHRLATMAAASSTARRPRSARCRTIVDAVGDRSRCTWTAASARARTC